MTVVALVVFPALELHDLNLAVAALGEDFGRDTAALDPRRAHFDFVAVGNQQDLIKLHGLAGLGIELLDAQHVALSDPILLAT